jgi:hypothetical protein
MPVSLSPLHKSIKEFDRAVLEVDSELKVSASLGCCLFFLVRCFNSEHCKFFSVIRLYKPGKFGPLGDTIH